MTRRVVLSTVVSHEFEVEEGVSMGEVEKLAQQLSHAPIGDHRSAGWRLTLR